jgi:hypothetical protein
MAGERGGISYWLVDGITVVDIKVDDITFDIQVDVNTVVDIQVDDVTVGGITVDDVTVVDSAVVDVLHNLNLTLFWAVLG